MADLDEFKSINDRYGHMTGDRFLVRAARIFESQLRKYDLAVRFRGEEFVLLLPGSSTDDARGRRRAGPGSGRGNRIA
jgi:diguanylate cyclase (GGDEF)-like protein